MSSAALPSSQSWAPGSAPTPALAALHKPWCEVRGKGWRSGKADQRGSRVVVGGMEPARCGDTSGPSHRHVEGLASLEPSCCQTRLGPGPSPLENMALHGSGGGAMAAAWLMAQGPRSRLVNHQPARAGKGKTWP